MSSRILHLYSVLTIALFILSSCSPAIYYLGDSYPSSSSVDVFYNAKEIKKEYKTMGRMTKEVLSYKAESDRKQMIETARKKGADGIIFSDLTLETDARKSDQVTVKAELIKYTGQ